MPEGTNIFNIVFEAPDYGNRFTASFKDTRDAMDGETWVKNINFNEFTKVGSADWSKIKKVMIVYSGPKIGEWRLVAMGVGYPEAETAFVWNPASGGVGSIGIDTTGTRARQTPFNVVSGTKSWVNLQHTYSTSRDWSTGTELWLNFEKAGTGERFTVTVLAPDWGNRFSKSFVDDSAIGDVILPRSSFVSVGNPSWSNVKTVQVAYGGTKQGSWGLSHITLMPMIPG